jgi:hypothetical protein
MPTHKVKEPKTIGDVVNNHSEHPTSDDWHPSFGRGYEERPEKFEECECNDCLTYPFTPYKRQEQARWDWQRGGIVHSRLYIFDTPRYIVSKPRESDIKYIARVSFCGSDDTTMEKFFEYEEDARRFICHLPPYISMEYLWDYGFRYS